MADNPNKKKQMANALASSRTSNNINVKKQQERLALRQKRLVKMEQSQISDAGIHETFIKKSTKQANPQCQTRWLPCFVLWSKNLQMIPYTFMKSC